MYMVAGFHPHTTFPIFSFPREEKNPDDDVSDYNSAYI